MFTINAFTHFVDGLAHIRRADAGEAAVAPSARKTRPAWPERAWLRRPLWRSFPDRSRSS